jgi:hypothetical protein
MNKNIWSLYKNSDRGKIVIKLFTVHEEDDELNWAEQVFKNYVEYLGEQVGGYNKERMLNSCINNFCIILMCIWADNLQLKENEGIDDYYERLIDNIELSEVEVNEEERRLYKEKDRIIYLHKQNYKSLCSILPELSLALFYLYPNVFFPILFRERFDVFMRILDVLEISMPELPTKPDKRGRLLFYKELVKNIYAFSKQHDLTAEETCACIYDFALMLLEDNQTKDEMPEPTNIWLTGACKEDYKNFLKNPIKDAKAIWTCNENTKRGDIIIMYVLSPYSCIQSIWRSDMDGVYTPFNYYNSRTRVTSGILISPITLNELKADQYFSQLGIVRKNFQGVNGVKFTAKDYKELQRLLSEKGFDISLLPQLYKPNLEIEGDIKNEKDVEEKLLIPLLTKLGYTEGDWTRQLSQKVGRNLKAIPDFVFLPKGELYFQNAPLIIEAKFDISSNIERTKSYNQALSYARMMKSSMFGICDKERLIIYKERKGLFDRFQPAFEKYWQNINDTETFNQLKLIIGKSAIQ